MNPSAAYLVGVSLITAVTVLTIQWIWKPEPPPTALKPAEKVVYTLPNSGELKWVPNTVDNTVVIFEDGKIKCTPPCKCNP
jgi:hypothetical protein